jgi:hypothetical protein
VTVSLQHCQEHIVYLEDVSSAAQVLEDVVFAETIAVRRCVVERSISDDHVAAVLGQDAAGT